jgi:hypothetical protein
VRTVESMDEQAGPDEAGVLRVQLELDLNHEPISGRLRTARGAEERFVGWLGFVDALKKLQDQGEGSPDPAGERPDS